MKRYGCKCGPLNDCGDPAGPGWMCETFGPGACSEWPVGDFVDWSLPQDELQAALEASTTKFYGSFDKNGGIVLEEVGMLAAAGLKQGDTLLAVEGFRLANQFDRRTILTWQFNGKKVAVTFVRKGRMHAANMDNPKGK
jgi:hypothetical protein